MRKQLTLAGVLVLVACTSVETMRENEATSSSVPTASSESYSSATNENALEGAFVVKGYASVQTVKDPRCEDCVKDGDCKEADCETFEQVLFHVTENENPALMNEKEYEPGVLLLGCSGEGLIWQGTAIGSSEPRRTFSVIASTEILSSSKEKQVRVMLEDSSVAGTDALNFPMCFSGFSSAMVLHDE